MSLTKKLRFEIFKRDSFTCQYCGRSAPDVTLNVDHIDPVANGGSNEILNLITSCFDCNQGKKHRLLSDDSIITKQKSQLDALQERREQIEMMLDWKRELLNLDEQAVAGIAAHWGSLVPSYYLNEHGKTIVRQWLKRFELAEILDAMNTAVGFYLVIEGEKATSESVEIAFNKIPGICVNKKRDAEKPYLKDVRYIRAVLANKTGYYDGNFDGYMEMAASQGLDWEWARRVARAAKNYRQFYNTITDEIGQD